MTASPHSPAARPLARVSFSALALLASMALPATAQELGTYLLQGLDDGGRTVESRLDLTSRTDGSLWLERVAYGPGRGPALTTSGVARWEGRSLCAELIPAGGLVRGVGGGPARPSSLVTYSLSGDRLAGEVRDGDGQVLVRESGRRLAEPLPVSSYSLADSSSAGANDHGRPIGVAAVNAGASALLRSLTPAEREVEFPVIVVLGYASEKRGPDQPLHKRTQRRARRAAAAMRKKGAHVILCSGSNVHPDGTPFNEALEMWRYLVHDLGVPPWRVAIDPFARHTTTNLRNAGRFLLAHQLSQALIVTSFGQSFYVSAPRLTTFHARCRETLGYEVGQLRWRSPLSTRFIPSPLVTTPGPDPLDP